MYCGISLKPADNLPVILSFTHYLIFVTGKMNMVLGQQFILCSDN